MVKMELTYEGNLRCQAVHEPSGAKLLTDAPKDNQGEGQSFSPTDLVATGLGSCILTIMGIVARRHQIDLAGTKVTVSKEMAQQPVRRIARLVVEITVPDRLSEDDKTRLCNAADTCPVKQSLHPDIEVPISWNWG